MDISALYLDIYENNISKVILQKIFGIQRTQLDRDINLFMKPTSPQKKKLSLPDVLEIQVLDFIRDSYVSYTPSSATHVLEYASLISGKTLSSGWIASFFERHADSLAEVTCTSIDSARANVDIQCIYQYIIEIKEALLNVPSCLCFNIDETGNSPSSTFHNYSAIIPGEFKNDPCYFKVERNEKNITSIVCITLDGDMLPPGIILPRATIPSEFDHCGIIGGINAVLLNSESGFINSNIFLIYFSKFIIPEIMKRREALGCQDFPALIMMDNRNPYISEGMIAICQQFNVRIVTYPHHTSHLFQTLDLLFFCPHEKEK